MTNITKESTTYAAKYLFRLLSELGFKSIEAFQESNNLSVDGIFGKRSYTSLYNSILNVKRIKFDGYYFKHGFKKKQIVWHHSAGWDNARSMFQWWKVDKRKHVATSIGITDDGTIYKGYDESYWAYHLGLNSRVLSSFKIPLVTPYGYHKTLIESHSVAVEICNWGQLAKRDGKFYSWANVEVPSEKVDEIAYRGGQYFERYTEAELSSLKYWTLLMAIRFDIPLTNGPDTLFRLDRGALEGKEGLYTHCSFRADKTDLYPSKEVLALIEELNNYHK